MAFLILIYCWIPNLSWTECPQRKTIIVSSSEYCLLSSGLKALHKGEESHFLCFFPLGERGSRRHSPSPPSPALLSASPLPRRLLREHHCALASPPCSTEAKMPNATCVDLSYKHWLSMHETANAPGMRSWRLGQNGGLFQLILTRT